ncbi:hypothetical protein SAMN05446037_102418 [Anaerovirgula multivorans]|uniref:Tetratricopeptide repeat-containing protein n=1 Tax=Anaerovirgula multivorans TaxID=312168 RepID=A0A239HVG0_9FIRM|nr:hypothetical protein [Anaerovirgula multivorans]SNS85299.1 hypothetical protein SAMN05446037_102418 [Anaerovirgula multivorans]
MYYWNKDNFQGLKDIGEKYSNISGYESFAKYCLLKEKGIKKQALKAIEEFILLTKNKSIDEQREIARELVSLSYYNTDIHQLLAHPLHQFLIKVLKDWAETKVTDVVPYRWLGYMCRDLISYEKALEINPTDEISIVELAKAELNYIDFQTHHLCETRFIGEIDDARNCLERVSKLIDKLKPGQLKDNMFEGYNYYKKLIDSWKEYKKKQRELSFPEWCESKEKTFKFWGIVYYNK